MISHSQFVESLKRLYKHGKIAIFKLKNMKTEGKITEDEFQYITSTGK